MAARLMIVNGPNLNYLGVREPHIYGYTTLAMIEAECRKAAEAMECELTFHQSNFEGEIVGWIQEGRDSADALIINPAGFSFTSIAIIDALKIFDKSIIELHISNIHARDKLHRHSIVSSVATSVICGLGPYGYIVAMQSALYMLGKVPAHTPVFLRPKFGS